MNPAIAIVGPTASGKTDLAMWLADHYPLHLISVDSALIYRGLNIGTAKPSAKELERYPHALIDICDVSESYSAAHFVTDALTEARKATEAGLLPCFVGGTTLYFNALFEGMHDLPEADAAVRQALAAEAEKIGWPALHQRLAEKDTNAAERIKPNDAQRIQRALELIELTGKTPTALYQAPKRVPWQWPSVRLALDVPRPLLHERIEQRFEKMMQQGFLAEVEWLNAKNLSRDLPACRSVGYRQLLGYLDQQYDLEEAIERGIYATRQLAKRQCTALRKMTNIQRLDTTADVTNVANEIINTFINR